MSILIRLDMRIQTGKQTKLIMKSQLQLYLKGFVYISSLISRTVGKSLRDISLTEGKYAGKATSRKELGFSDDVDEDGFILNFSSIIQKV